MTDYKICREWHDKTTVKDGWLISQNEKNGCICEFEKCSYPIGLDIVRLYKIDNRYKYVHSKRYYRGSDPRYLEKQEHIVDHKDNYMSLSDLLTYLENS